MTARGRSQTRGERRNRVPPGCVRRDGRQNSAGTQLERRSGAGIEGASRRERSQPTILAQDMKSRRSGGGGSGAIRGRQCMPPSWYCPSGRASLARRLRWQWTAHALRGPMRPVANRRPGAKLLMHGHAPAGVCVAPARLVQLWNPVSRRHGIAVAVSAFGLRAEDPVQVFPLRAHIRHALMRRRGRLGAPRRSLSRLPLRTRNLEDSCWTDPTSVAANDDPGKSSGGRGVAGPGCHRIIEECPHKSSGVLHAARWTACSRSQEHDGRIAALDRRSFGEIRGGRIHVRARDRAMQPGECNPDSNPRRSSGHCRPVPGVARLGAGVANSRAGA
jgi:hypothetical protein